MKMDIAEKTAEESGGATILEDIAAEPLGLRHERSGTDQFCLELIPFSDVAF